MNQRDIILQHLKTGQWFSLADALSLQKPIYRLSERIRELEKQGYKIEHRRAAGKTYEEYQLKQTIQLPPAFKVVTQSPMI